MDLQELAASIIADARREAAKVENDAHEQVSRYETETERLLRERRERAIAAAQRRREEMIRRESAKAQSHARLAVLACKRELIDAVFSQARDRLIATKGTARKAILQRLLARAKRSLAFTNVTATKPDAPALRAMGVRVRNTVDGIGGFIAYDADGHVGVDVRFDTIIEQVRADATSEIASILFARDAPTRKAVKRPAGRSVRSKRTVTRRRVR